MVQVVKNVCKIKTGNKYNTEDTFAYMLTDENKYRFDGKLEESADDSAREVSLPNEPPTALLA